MSATPPSTRWIILALLATASAGFLPPASGIAAAGPPDGEIFCGMMVWDFCGTALWDSRNLEDQAAWALTPCAGPGRLTGFRWITIENNETDWTGFADWAVWDADTVENGCANDDTILLGARDVPAERQPFIDENGDQIIAFGRLAWVYFVAVNRVRLPRRDLYFGARITTANQSFVFQRDPDDKPIYFQSTYLGIPCAVRAEDIVGLNCAVAFAPLVKSSVSCGKIRRFKTICKGDQIVAKVKTKLPEGTTLTVQFTHDRETLTIGANGKGRTKWTRAGYSPYTVQIIECTRLIRFVGCRF